MVQIKIYIIYKYINMLILKFALSRKHQLINIHINKNNIFVIQIHKHVNFKFCIE